jgi:2-polyprenyl-3-methyl-5-hydroxy-6-metoxy-1,4-benzoquinol methylase
MVGLKTDPAVASQIMQSGEGLLAQRCDVEAMMMYMRILEDPEWAARACVRLGEIYNRLGNPVRARQFHLRSFQLDAHLAQKCLRPDHPSHNYVYAPPAPETQIRTCPLCHTDAFDYDCHNQLAATHFTPGFNPIRMWMKCANCTHVFAENYPVDLGAVLSAFEHQDYLKPKSEILNGLGNILSDLIERAPGINFLDVGIGAGEMAGVAREMLLDVEGLDIRPSYAAASSQTFQIPVHVCDFMSFESPKKYAIVTMGDVVEHLPDPLPMLRKARDLMSPGGLLWISTPNIESAYHAIVKDLDCMLSVCEHLHFFSFKSLKLSLESCGFDVLRLHKPTSAHDYAGTMHVTAKRV